MHTPESNTFSPNRLLSITGASFGEGAGSARSSCAGLHAAASTAPRATAQHRPAKGTASKREPNGGKGSVDTATGTPGTGTAGTCPTATKAKAKRTKPAGASDLCCSGSATALCLVLYMSARQSRTLYSDTVNDRFCS